MCSGSEIQYQYNVFYLHKDGNYPEEYEDAYALNRNGLVAALADGASDSIYTKEWTRLLVEGFVQTPFGIGINSENLVRWLEPLQQEWQSQIDWKNLPWYKERKARIGAFSTLLTLQLVTTEERSDIVSLAIGDSCLFVLASNDSYKAFPIQSAQDFDNSPSLLPSYQRYNSKLAKQIKVLCCDASNINSIIMATDAFSKWFVLELEKGNQPWHMFENIDQQKFTGIIDSLRKTNEIRNDDTTAIFITLTP